MRISVIGAGYVGLVSGVCLAEVGNQVVCADRRPDRVNSILRGSSPIYEPGLDQLLRRNLENGRLTATLDSAQAVLNSDATIIAVATPCTNGMIDLSQVKEAVRETGQALKNKPKYHVVAVKSTVIPSTTDTIVKPILEKSSGKSLGEFGLCTNPEFLREGNAVEDFLKPDRIVIGSNDEKSFRVFKRIYSAFRCPILHTNLRTAEMIKYAGNSLLAALISYSNEVATIGEAIGDIDVVDVMNAVHLDSRLTPIVNGPAKSFKRRISPGILVYLKAGCGYGGSCLPKDVQALYAFTKKIGYEPQLLKSVIRINKHQPLRLVSRLSKKMGGLQNKKVAVWGLAFKPDTDDVRETPAKPIVDSLVRAGARVSVYDPIASENARKMLFKTCLISYPKDKLEAVRGAHALVVVTAWAQFKGVDFQKLTKLMRRNAIVVDGRRIYTRESVIRAGLRYLGVGYEELK